MQDYSLNDVVFVQAYYPYLSKYIPSSEWNLLNYTIETTVYNLSITFACSMFVISMQIQRSPMYYINNVWCIRTVIYQLSTMYTQDILLYNYIDV